MEQWEYLELYIYHREAKWVDSQGRSGRLEKPPQSYYADHYQLAPLLNDLGAEGWELLVKDTYGYLFMRPKLQEGFSS